MRIASPKLQADAEIVIAAVSQHGHALRFYRECNTNHSLASRPSFQTRWAAEDLTINPANVLAAVASNAEALTHAAPELLEGREHIRPLIPFCLISTILPNYTLVHSLHFILYSPFLDPVFMASAAASKRHVLDFVATDQRCVAIRENPLLVQLITALTW